MSGRSRARLRLGLAGLAAAVVVVAVSDRAQLLLGSLGLLPPKQWMPAYRSRLVAHAWSNARLPDGCAILLGDSLSELFPAELAAPHGWVKRGISGDRVRDVAMRLEVSALDAPCASVFLLIGSNDAVHHGAEPDALAAAIRALVDELVAGGKRVRVHTLPPTRGRYAEATRGIRATNRLLRESAWPEGVELVDLEAALGDPEGLLRAEYSSDGLHLSEAGYRRWERLLAGGFRSTSG